MATDVEQIKNDEGMDKDVYLQHINVLYETEADQARQFDRAVLTLASAALGLSITFLKDIVPHPIPTTIYWLVSAWVLLTASILSTLTSFQLSQSALRRAREIWDSKYEDQENCLDDDSNRLSGWVIGLNWTSLVLFVAGVLIFVAFVSLNIWDEKMVENKNIRNNYVEGGVAPPQSPVKHSDTISKRGSKLAKPAKPSKNDGGGT